MSRHPAWQEGRDAFRIGKLFNPHKKGTIAFKEYEAGINYEYFVNLNRNLEQGI